jgi:hypothetical protein
MLLHAVVKAEVWTRMRFPFAMPWRLRSLTQAAITVLGQGLMAARCVVGGDSGLDYACDVLRPEIESSVESLYVGTARSALDRTIFHRPQSMRPRLRCSSFAQGVKRRQEVR